MGKFPGMKKKRGTKKTTKKGTKVTRKVSINRSAKSPFVKNVVRAVLGNICEVKSVNQDPTSYGFLGDNSVCSPAVSLVGCIENTSTGNTDGARIGNRIVIKEFNVKMNFTMAPGYVSGATFRPGYVFVWLATLKSDPAGSPNAVDLTRIYDDGSGAAGPDHTVLSTMRNLNRNYFNFIRHKRFKLGGAGSPYPNNDFPIQKSLTFKNVLKGEVIYNDGLLANNKKLYMFCHFVTVDSVRLTVTPPVLCDYYVSCKYLDL